MICTDRSGDKAAMNLHFLLQPFLPALLMNVQPARDKAVLASELEIDTLYKSDN